MAPAYPLGRVMQTAEEKWTLVQLPVKSISLQINTIPGVSRSAWKRSVSSDEALRYEYVCIPVGMPLHWQLQARKQMLWRKAFWLNRFLVIVEGIQSFLFSLKYFVFYPESVWLSADQAAQERTI